MLNSLDASNSGGKFRTEEPSVTCFEREPANRRQMQIDRCTRVNGVDGKDFLFVCIGQQLVGIPANVIGAERHIAAEACRFEVLIGEVEVCAQST